MNGFHFDEKLEFNSSYERAVKEGSGTHLVIEVLESLPDQQGRQQAWSDVENNRVVCWGYLRLHGERGVNVDNKIRLQLFSSSGGSSGGGRSNKKRKQHQSDGDDRSSKKAKSKEKKEKKKKGKKAKSKKGSGDDAEAADADKEAAADAAAAAAAATAEAAEKENLEMMAAATEGAAGLLSSHRTVYPSSIFITVSKVEVENVHDNDSDADADEEAANNRALIDHNKARWQRAPDEPCFLPITMQQRLPASEMGCFTLTFSHDGQWLAAGCSNQGTFPINIYRVLDSAQQCDDSNRSTLDYVFSAHLNLVYDIAWADDDKMLLSASSDSTARLWDTAGFSAAPLKTMPHPCFVYSAKFRPGLRGSQQQAITTAFDGLVRIWDMSPDTGPNGSLLHELSAHTSLVNDCVFNRKGDTLYTVDGTGCVQVWGPNYGSTLFGRGSPEDKVEEWSITQVVEWLGDEGFLLEMVLAHDEHVNGQMLLELDHDTLIRLGFSGVAERDGILQKVVQLKHKNATGVPSEWEPLKAIRHPELADKVLTSIVMHPNDKSVLIHARDNVARLLNVEDQTVSKQFSCTRNSNVWARSCISPCGQFVIAGADDGTAHAWDSLTGKKLHHYADLALQGALSDVAFHPHDNLIAFASFGSSQSVVVAHHVPGSEEWNPQVAGHLVANATMGNRPPLAPIGTFLGGAGGASSMFGSPRINKKSNLSPIRVTSPEDAGAERTARQVEIEHLLGGLSVGLGGTARSLTSDAQTLAERRANRKMQAKGRAAGSLASTSTPGFGSTTTTPTPHGLFQAQMAEELANANANGGGVLLSPSPAGMGGAGDATHMGMGTGAGGGVSGTTMSGGGAGMLGSTMQMLSNLTTAQTHEELYRAEWKYDAKQPDELTFKWGDFIYVDKQRCDPNGWWFGRLAASDGDGESPPVSGLIPKNYIAPFVDPRGATLGVGTATSMPPAPSLPMGMGMDTAAGNIARTVAFNATTDSLPSFTTTAGISTQQGMEHVLNAAHASTLAGGANLWTGSSAGGGQQNQQQQQEAELPMGGPPADALHAAAAAANDGGGGGDDGAAVAERGGASQADIATRAKAAAANKSSVKNSASDVLAAARAALRNARKATKQRLSGAHKVGVSDA